MKGSSLLLVILLIAVLGVVYFNYPSVEDAISQATGNSPEQTAPTTPLWLEGWPNTEHDPNKGYCYIRKDGHIYYKRAEGEKLLLKADASSFQEVTDVHGSCYGKDASNAYRGEDIISGADIATWEFGGGFFGISKDKYHFFIGTSIIPWANPAVPGSFDLLYFSDRLFYRNGSGIMAISHEDINKADAVSRFEPIPNADSATFKKLNSPFDRDFAAKDKNQVYCRGKILVGADLTTFNTDLSLMDRPLVNNRYLLARDKNHIYDSECEIVPQ